MANIFGAEKGQADQRGWRVFRDQHGRGWGATVENSSVHPVGPLTPQFEAPLIPPNHFLKLFPGDQQNIEVDYDAWLKLLDAEQEEWETSMWEHAMLLPGDTNELVKNPPPALVRAAGRQPRVYKDVVLAARNGNRWVLFNEGEMPAKAAQYFVVETKAVEKIPDEDPFAEAGTQVVTVPAEDNEPDPFADDGEGLAFMPTMHGPGWWTLSNGERVRGKKADAYAAQRELEAGAPAGV